MTDNDHSHSSPATFRDHAATDADRGSPGQRGGDRHRAASGHPVDYDAEAVQGLAGDTPVVERGRIADLDPSYDDEIGMQASPGFEAGTTQASVDDGQYGMNHRRDDPATGQSDPGLLGAMGMGQPDTSHSHAGFDDEDEQGLPGNAGYDGDVGDPESADGMSGAGASYGVEPADGPLLGEFGVGSGHANPEEPGFSSDEDTLIDDATLDRAAGGGGIEMPPPSPGVDIPMPSEQPGYGDDGNDIEVEIPVPQESDVPNPWPNPPGQDPRT